MGIIHMTYTFDAPSGISKLKQQTLSSYNYQPVNKFKFVYCVLKITKEMLTTNFNLPYL